MKKAILTTIISIMSMSAGFAQFSDVSVLQPTNIVAKRFDVSGQLIKETMAAYSYNEDGKLTGFVLPDHSLTSSYFYSDNLLTREFTRHDGGHPVYDESFNYTYEYCRIKTKTHLWGQMNANEYWTYQYDSYGRIERMDYKEEYDDDYHVHYLYEYEDEGRTVTENFWTSWNTQGLLLRKKTVFQYDGASNLLSEHAESYSTEGEPTMTTLITYSYSSTGKEESKTSQTLTDGEWVNTSIVRYVYDDNDKVSERQAGVWSEGAGEWNITAKTVYELDEEALTLTVSFYKKEGDEWVWDSYGSQYFQPVFYDSYLEEQQHALRFFSYDDLFNDEHVSQFVFTLAETNAPVYTDIEEKEAMECNIYPNPSDGIVTVTGKTLRQAEVFNAAGQCTATATGTEDEIRIDLRQLPAGIYFVTVTDAEGRKCVKKVVKE